MVGSRHSGVLMAAATTALVCDVLPHPFSPTLITMHDKVVVSNLVECLERAYIFVLKLGRDCSLDRPLSVVALFNQAHLKQ